MAAKQLVLHQPVQRGDGPVPLYHPADDGSLDLGRLVQCKCGGTRWDVELVGKPFTDKDGVPAQTCKYTCSECGGGVQDHAVPLKTA